LGVEDPGHAFYLGRELMKARLALLLGKTYVQEQPLRWGYLTPAAEDSRHGRVRLEGPRRDRPAREGTGTPTRRRPVPSSAWSGALSPRSGPWARSTRPPWRRWAGRRPRSRGSAGWAAPCGWWAASCSPSPRGPSGAPWGGASTDQPQREVEHVRADRHV